MTSGTGWAEDYRDPSGPAARLLSRWRSGTGGMRDELLAIPPADPPGSRYAYCTPDSLVLDWARERATGESFQTALAPLWAAIEAERPAVVGLDQPAASGGVAMAGRSAGRDGARLGQDRRSADRRQLARQAGRQPRLDGCEQQAGTGLSGARPSAEHDHHARGLRLPLVAA